MKIKFDPYVASQFNRSSLLFDNKTGLLYYRNAAKKLQVLPNQHRNLAKLVKIIEYGYSDINTSIKYEKEIKQIHNILRKHNNTQKKHRIIGNRKTKSFWGLF
jgi:hypothetical protein